MKSFIWVVFISLMAMFTVVAFEDSARTKRYSKENMIFLAVMGVTLATVMEIIP